MKYIKEYNNFEELDYLNEQQSLNVVWRDAIGDHFMNYIGKTSNNVLHGVTQITDDYLRKSYDVFLKNNKKVSGDADLSSIEKDAEDHASDIVKNIKDEDKKNIRHKKEYDKYIKDRKKEQENGDIISFEEFKQTVNDRLRQEKIMEVRKKLSTLLLAISIGLIIVGGIGGAIMSLRSVIVAHEKRKNKKKTGSDKLTEKQEDTLYKILVISKVMVIIGGIGGALRSFKFLIKTKQDYTGFEDDHGFMGDIDHRESKNETTDYVKLGENTYKLISKSKTFNAILDKLGAIKGMNNVVQSATENASGLEEDVVINVAKMNMFFDRYLTKSEQKEIMKLSGYAIATIHENISYNYDNILNEASDKDIENMYNMAIKIIGQDKIDNIVEKVWDKNIENELKELEKIKDGNKAAIKISEIKKTIDMKLDYHEKQELIKLGEKLL